MPPPRPSAPPRRSVPDAAAHDIDRLWRIYLRQFDIEHTFRSWKQTLGLTRPRLRRPGQADRWTWLIIAAYTQLRLARPLADNLRRPWEKPLTSDQLTPGRVRRGYPRIRRILSTPPNRHDLTAFAGFPERHWKKIQSTNPPERINREIKRRVDVVQVFPNDDALLRLVIAVLFEMHDEWIAFPRRYLPEGSMEQVYPAERLDHAPTLPNTTNATAD
ncbi:hypothetical protein FCI23_41570 [Actinacidiphila oryziradicis]|uniref:Mutator family transposase n=1 Tax=Actinacidiphila oryziradicis TaxID=2571141 RepID=A0A4U0RZ07_9ACTN|nr:hypothetical protein FCI23_41570 [Actinacidiphila oryziradicis]